MSENLPKLSTLALGELAQGLCGPSDTSNGTPLSLTDSQGILVDDWWEASHTSQLAVNPEPWVSRRVVEYLDIYTGQQWQDSNSPPSFTSETLQEATWKVKLK